MRYNHTLNGISRLVAKHIADGKIELIGGYGDSCTLILPNNYLANSQLRAPAKTFPGWDSKANGPAKSVALANYSPRRYREGKKLKIILITN